MSLNGLDAPEVQDAHNAAVADPAGWFLLKYTSRDGVELHGRGRGGVNEARASVASYPDASPLYGLLIYRRRKVLIKYIPTGTSRVLQVRTAVHFQDVIEKYSPYETLLEISTAEGLSDTSLAASFPLHTASTSAASNRLNEISEDAEDPGAAPRSAPAQGKGGLFGRRQYNSARPKRGNEATALAPSKNSIASQILIREDSGKRSITSLAGSPLSNSIASYDTASSETSATTRSENDSKSSFGSDASKALPRTSATLQRPGTQGSSNTATGVEPLLDESNLTVSPPLSRGSDTQSHAERMKNIREETFDFSYLDPKPKVKLGPRIAGAKKLNTTGVSALPSHYRPQTKRADQPAVSPITPSQLNPFPSLPIPPIPAFQEYDPRPVSRGSVKSLPSHKSTTMTPDKLRLMKAVELRKRQLRKSNPSLPSIVPGIQEEAPEVPDIPERIPEQPKLEAKEARLDEVRKAGIEEEATASKADSGIQMAYQKPEQQEKTVEPAANLTEAVPEEPQAQSEPQQPAETALADTTPSTATVDPIQEKIDATEDPAIAEALRNDELKAEAEGYAAIPLQTPPDEPPSIMPYGSPSQPSDFSPASKAPESTPKEASEVEHAGTATTVAADTAEVVEVPKLVMSPASPMVATYHPTGMPPALLKQEAAAEEDDDDDLPTVQTSPRRQNSDMAKRRRGVVEPLHLESQAELLSDDDLMDELQDATVQEARPMAVGKSPVTPYFSRRPSNQSLISAKSQHSSRSGSVRTITANREKTAEELENHAPLADPISLKSSSDKVDIVSGIKKNVGAGITKRFQALTEGHREIAVATPVTLSPSRSVETSPNSKRNDKHRSRTASFKGRWGIGDRTSSSSTIASTPEHATTWTVSQDGASRDSISVRARIVRPPSGLDTHAEKPDSEGTAATLQQSKLEINHSVGKNSTPINNASTAPTSVTTTPAHRRGNQSVTTLVTTPEDFPAPPSSANTASSVTSDDASTITGVPTSRTSRFFKRMSALGGGNKRRSLAQPSPTQHANVVDTKPSTRRSSKETLPAAALGDLNVQFPDTLLWKRRWLTLDAAGNLILGIPQSLENQRGLQSKSYALSEFKLPYIPDLDRQEIPHSICLDFIEGGTLQIACEDAMGQKQVLSIVKQYWRSWAG